MGTSLSGLTPATTFDGLLKTSDNDALDATLKTIGTGDGTDSVLQLSDSALQIGGTFNVDGGIATFKGVGSSYLTSSFIIKNSADAEIFRVRDDGQIYATYISAQSVNASSYALYGADYAPNIRVNIKGSGATSATTSLLVQNSAGTDIFKVKDNEYVEFSSAKWYTYLTSNISFLRKTGAGSMALYIDASNFLQLSSTGVSIGKYNATAKLDIQGSGATSATTALLVQNSAGTRIMEAQDGGNIFFGASASHYLQNGYNWFGSYYFLNTQTFRGALQNDLGSVKISDDLNVGGNADNDTGVRLQVKGSGNDATTTALLVENSAGTQLFKIFDDGNIRIGDSIANKETHFRKFRITDASIFPLSSGNLGENDNTARHYGNIYSLGVTHITDNTTSSTTLDASAKLQVDSTTQGFLPPRMTDAERDAITNPAAGLMIYDTSNNQMNYWNGSTWIAF